jgi:predicted ATPase/DNA-binding CsgD family transcriptional regulator
MTEHALEPVPRAGNLPVELTSFVGRRRELAAAARLLATTRLLTLTGPGGVGKTRLALRLATTRARAFPDGVWLADLTDPDGDPVPALVAAAVGAPEPTARGLGRYLAGRELLLVLDSCEARVAECAALADAMLRAAPGVRLLATSQQPLRVDGEAAYALAPLPVPDSTDLPARALGQYDAVTLFGHRAAAAVPDFAVTDANCADVVRLCRRLDGIPLALELAAPRLRALSLRQLLDRLDDRFELLSQGSRSGPAHHRTLRGLMDRSWALCGEPERLLWTRLSVFRGGFDLPAAEAVCTDAALPRPAVVTALAGLVDASVLVREDRPAGPRYRLLETLGRYGHGRLVASGAAAAVRARHRDRYRVVATRALAGWASADREWLARLRAEHANLRAALEFCLAEPAQGAGALEIADALSRYDLASGQVLRDRPWLDAVLAADPSPTPGRARLLWVSAWLRQLAGDPDAAGRLLEAYRDLAERLGDRLAPTRLAHFAGHRALLEHDAERALGRLSDACAGFRAAGDPGGLLPALSHLAAADSLLGDPARALGRCQEALALAERHGAQWVRSWLLWAAGVAHARLGHRSRATETMHGALRLKRELGDWFGAALCLQALSRGLAAGGQQERAARLAGAADTGLRALGIAVPGRRPQTGPVSRLAGQRTLESAVRDALGEGTDDPPAPRADRPTLTRRELETARLVCRGLTNREIAATLVIARRTAETHIQNILTKLGFSSRAQIAAWVTAQPW